MTITRPVGSFQARLVVTDHQGLTDDASVTFEVADTSAPTVSMTLGLTSLWPADHDLNDVGLAFTPNNNRAPSLDVLVTVTSDEGSSNAPNGRGPRTQRKVDAVLDENGTLWLRADRLDSGDGRVYRVTATVTDEAGLEAAANASVGVAQRPNRPAIDSGPTQTLASREFTVGMPEPELPLVWVIAGEPRVTSYDNGQPTIVWDALRDATSYRVTRTTSSRSRSTTSRVSTDGTTASSSSIPTPAKCPARSMARSSRPAPTPTSCRPAGSSSTSSPPAGSPATTCSSTTWWSRAGTEAPWGPR